MLFTPLEKATDEVGGNYLGEDGGFPPKADQPLAEMPPSAQTVRGQSSLTGFTLGGNVMEKLALFVSGTIFVIVSIMHLLRLIFNLPIKIGNFMVPLRLSLFACIASLLLSMWIFIVLVL